jgi:DNA-3-methyladenine glycosylase II
MSAPLNAATLAEAAAVLARRDPDLARLFNTHGPPPLWSRRPGFRTLVHIVLEQQVSLVSARATLGRLVTAVAPFTPARVAELGSDHLRSLGVTRQKAGYCVELADAIVCGRCDLRALTRMDDDAVRQRLTALKGVGPWTADIYLLMALRRADVWPAGDLALIQALRHVKRLPSSTSALAMSTLAEAWRPFRSVAARMLWQHYLAGGHRQTSSG